MKEFVPSWVKYKSTKFVWLVNVLFTSTDVNIASVLLTLVEKILDVVATETVVLIPDKLTNPMVWVPIPVRFVLNEVFKILIS